MDPKTKEQLNLFVQKMIDLADKGVDFSVEQIPLVVQEWLNWQAAEAMLFLALGVFIWIVTRIIFVKVREGMKGSGDEGVEWIPAMIGTVIGTIVIFANAYHLIKVLVAPRVVLVEEFARWLQ